MNRLEFSLNISNVTVKSIFESGPYNGGSKERKASYFFKDAEENKADAIVSAGAANSNHAKVVALNCAKRGWKCTIVVHDEEDYSKGNLLLMKLSGAHLIFTTLSEVGLAMDKEMERYRDQGHNPYYIYGGGHGLPGYLSYYDAVKDYARWHSDFIPDYIIHASGTCGTQVGLIVGFRDIFPKSKVIGVSVARSKKRGVEVIREGCDNLSRYLGVNRVSDDKICFRDDWVGDGYGKTYPSLIRIIKEYAVNYGFLADPTYTGKALHGMHSMIENGEIPPGSKVLFWHTGGLINLFEYTEKLI